METVEKSDARYDRITEWLHSVLDVEDHTNYKPVHGSAKNSSSGPISARRKHHVEQSCDPATGQED